LKQVVCTPIMYLPCVANFLLFFAMCFSESSKIHFCINQTCGPVHVATISATLRVADLLCMDDDIEGALQLLLILHKQVRNIPINANMAHCFPFLLTRECVQCLRQLGSSNTDTIAMAFAAGCMCSKIGDVRQAEALLRQAYSACKMVAEVWDMLCCAFQCIVIGSVAGGWKKGVGA
jgi:hypothetical protein